MNIIKGILVVTTLVSSAYIMQLQAAEMNPKTTKYYQILKKRPEAGYLFDRFYNSWLTTGSLKELEAFLQEEAKKDNDAELLLAMFYQKEGKDVAALTMFENALKDSPDSALILFHKGSLEISSASFEPGIATLKLALEKNPKKKLKEKILKLLGQAFVRNDDTTHATQTWNELLKLDEQDESLIEDLIDLQLSEGLYDDAARHCRQLITKVRGGYKRTVLEMRLGDILQLGGKEREALEIYSKTLEKVEDGSWIEKELLSQIERVFRQEGRVPELKTYYSKLLESYSKRINILKRYATILQESGHRDESLKIMRRVIELTPGDRNNKVRYVNMLAKNEEYAKAVTVMKELVTQYPKDVELLINLVGIEQKSGDKKAVVATVKKYVELVGLEFSALRGARILASYEMTAEATAVYERALKKFPKSAGLKEAMADHLYANSKKERAVKLYLSLVEPRKVESIIRVAKSLSFHQEHQHAYELLKKYEKDGSQNSNFINLLYKESLALDKKEEALDYALQRVKMAVLVGELELAISDAGSSLRYSPKSEALISELKKRAKSENEWCLLAEIYHQKLEVNLSINALKLALKQYANSEKIISQQVRYANMRENWKVAIEGTKHLLGHFPDRRALYIGRLVSMCLRAEKMPEALRWISEWKKSATGSTAPYLAEADVYVRQNKFDRATKLLRIASYKFPQEDAILQALATAYLSQGQQDDAIRVQWKRLQFAKNLEGKLQVVSQLCRLSIQQGQEQKLLKHFETREKNNPKELFSLMALATIHRQLGHYEERRRYLLKSTTLQPNNVSLLYAIAKIEEQEGEYDKMLLTLEKALELKNSPAARQRIIRYHFKYGDEESGYRILGAMVTNDSISEKEVGSIANVLVGSNRPEKAIEFLKPLMDKYTDNCEISYLYAVALEDAERFDEAVDAFLKVLKIKKKWAQSNGGNNSYRQRQRRSVTEKVFPTEVVDFMRISEVSRSLYSYKTDGNSYSTRMSGGHKVAVPPTKKMVQAYVIGRLKMIRKQMSEVERLSLVDHLSSIGVPHADLKFQFDINLFTKDTNVDWKAFHKRYPNDGLVKSLEILTRINSGLTKEDLENVYTIYKETHPQLVILAMIGGVHFGISDKKYIAKSLALLPKVKYMPLEAFTVILGNVLKEGKMKPEPRRQLVMWLLKLYQQDTKRTRVSMQTSHFAFALFSEYLKTEQFISVLEEEVARFKKRNGNHAKGMGRRSRYWGRTQGFSKKVPFPPTELNGFPPHLLTLLKSEKSNSRLRFTFLSHNRKSALLPLIGAIKDPILKLLMANYCKQDITPQIEAIAKAPSIRKDLTKAWLVASWQLNNKKVVEAITLLKAVRNLPMTRELRQKIDVVILTVASSHKADKFLLEEGKKAALRLKNIRLNDAERSALLTQMEALGMPKEADKLDKKINAASSVRSRRGFSSYRGQQNTRELVTKLFNEGKEMRALKKIMYKFRPLSTGTLPTSNSYSQGLNSWEMKQFRQQIITRDLEESFMKLMGVGKDLTSRKSLEVALAYEWFKKDNEALELYDKILKKSPKELRAITRKTMLLAKMDKKKLKAYIDSVNRKLLTKVGNRIFNRLSSYSNDNQKHIEEAAFGILERLHRDKGVPSQLWVDTLMKPVTGNEINIFDKHFAGFVKRIKNEDLLKRYHGYSDIFERICKITNSDPKLMRSGFSNQYQYLIAKGEKIDSLKPLAERILLNEELSKGINPHSLQQMSRLSYLAFLGRSVVTPELLLVEDAYMKKRPEAVNTLVTTLKNTGKDKTITRVKQLDKLFRSDGEMFLKAADEYKISTSQKSISSAARNALKYSTILRIVSKMNKKVDIRSYMMKKVAKEGSSYEGTEFLSLYMPQLMTHCYNKGGTKALEEVTDKLVLIVLGKEKPNKSSNFQQGTDSKTIALAAIFTKLAFDVDMAFEILKYTQNKPRLTKYQEVISYAIRELAFLYYWDWDFIKKTPILDHWKSFDPIAAPKKSGIFSRLTTYSDYVNHGSSNNVLMTFPKSVLKMIIMRLGADNSASSVVRSELDKVKKKTLGIKVFEMLLNTSTKQEKSIIDLSLQLFTNFVPEFQVASKADQDHFFTRIMSALPNKGLSSTLSILSKGVIDQKQKEFLELAVQFSKRRNNSKLTEFLKAKSINELTKHNYQFAEKVVKPLLEQALGQGKEKAKMIYLHAYKLMTVNGRYTATRNNGRRVTMKEQLLSQVCPRYYDINSLSKVALAAFVQNIVDTSKQKQKFTTDFIDRIARTKKGCTQYLINRLNRNSQNMGEEVTTLVKNLTALQINLTHTFIGTVLVKKMGNAMQKKQEIKKTLDYVKSHCSKEELKSAEEIILVLEAWHSKNFDKLVSFYVAALSMNNTSLSVGMDWYNSLASNRYFYDLSHNHQVLDVMLALLEKENKLNIGSNGNKLQNLSAALLKEKEKLPDWNKKADIYLNYQDLVTLSPAWDHKSTRSKTDLTENFKFAIARGDKPRIIKYWQNHKMRLSEASFCYVYLLNAGYVDLAIEGIKRSAPKLRATNEYYRSQFRFTAKGKENAASFIKKVEGNDELQIVLKALCAAFGYGDREAVARQFSTKKFTDEKLKKACLELLINSPYTPLFADEVIKSQESSNLLNIVNRNDPFMLKSYSNYLLLLMLKGEFDTVQKKLVRDVKKSLLLNKPWVITSFFMSLRRDLNKRIISESKSKADPIWLTKPAEFASTIELLMALCVNDGRTLSNALICNKSYALTPDEFDNWAKRIKSADYFEIIRMTHGIKLPNRSNITNQINMDISVAAIIEYYALLLERTKSKKAQKELVTHLIHLSKTKVARDFIRHDIKAWNRGFSRCAQLVKDPEILAMLQQKKETKIQTTTREIKELEEKLKEQQRILAKLKKTNSVNNQVESIENSIKKLNTELTVERARLKLYKEWAKRERSR